MKEGSDMRKGVRGYGIGVVISFWGLLLGCSAESRSGPAVAGRWYTVDQVERGKTQFLDHCAQCHGESGEGTVVWRKVDENGNYPPPPLNGSAHTWHHPMSILEGTIADGGITLGGVMPGFSSTLNRDDVRAIVAYFQTFWPDEIYTRWEEINSR